MNRAGTTSQGAVPRPHRVMTRRRLLALACGAGIVGAGGVAWSQKAGAPAAGAPAITVYKSPT
jgi:hypothetical protein